MEAGLFWFWGSAFTGQGVGSPLAAPGDPTGGKALDHRDAIQTAAKAPASTGSSPSPRFALSRLVIVGLFAFLRQQIDPDNFFASGPTRTPPALGAALKDLVVSGLTQGAMYGLIALGYSMVYGVLGFINFAHGEVFMRGR